MKRVFFSATVIACVCGLSFSPRAGAAETQTSALPALRAIALEVVIVDLRGAAKDEQAAELSGPSDKVAARIRQLEAEGQIVAIDRFQLTTVENLKVHVQQGMSAPVAAARSFAGRGGPTQTSYQYHDLGTSVYATARVDGDAIVAELEVEKSALEQRPDSASSEDQFVPLATETLTSQVTVRIRSGETILASGLEKRTGAESSSQLVLASARLLGPSTHELSTPAQPADTKETQIFTLQRIRAKDAAAVAKELFHTDAAEMTVSVETSTNSLIVKADKRRLDLLSAVLLRLDECEPQALSQAPKRGEQATATRPPSKYDTMDKTALQEEIKRLHNEVRVAEQTARKAKDTAAEAERACQSAPDGQQPDALLRALEAEAASRKPIQHYMRIRSELEAAKHAYLRLLCAE